MYNWYLLNDITTTYPLAPTFPALSEKVKDRDFSYSEKNYFLQIAKYEIGALPIARPIDACFALAEMVAQSMPRWHIVSSDRNAKRIEAIEITPILKFKVYFSIEIRDNSNGSLSQMYASNLRPDTIYSWIHCRSKSRNGRSDLGTNILRIKKYFSEIQEAENTSV